METNNSILKKEIRKTILAKRRQLPESDRALASQRLLEFFRQDAAFQMADSILLFCSYGSEIDTFPLIRYCLEQKYKVYVPKSEQDGSMTFYRMTAVEQLVEGYMGIPEPAGDTEHYVYNEKEPFTDVIVMPGAVFDTFNNRIGYGGGYYDRYLSDKPKLLERSVAIGYACQRVEQIPSEAHDLKPTRIFCF